MTTMIPSMEAILTSMEANFRWAGLDRDRARRMGRQLLRHPPVPSARPAAVRGGHPGPARRAHAACGVPGAPQRVVVVAVGAAWHAQRGRFLRPGIPRGAVAADLYRLDPDGHLPGCDQPAGLG